MKSQQKKMLSPLMALRKKRGLVLRISIIEIAPFTS